MPRSRGFKPSSLNPEKIFAPIGCSLNSDGVVFCNSVALILCKNIAIKTGIKSIVAEISIKPFEPIVLANTMVMRGPQNAPRLLPAAIKPNSLFACSLLYVSAMKLQKTEMFNRLKTLTQT